MHDDPSRWAPLLSLLGDDLVADFMWMHQIELPDGTTVQAYKNITTRRYLHLDEAGRTLTHTGRHLPTDPYNALAHAFDGWRDLPDGRTELMVLRAALRAAWRRRLAT